LKNLQICKHRPSAPEDGGRVICQTTSAENAEFIAEALAAKEIIFPILAALFDG